MGLLYHLHEFRMRVKRSSWIDSFAVLLLMRIFTLRCTDPSLVDLFWLATETLRAEKWGAGSSIILKNGLGMSGPPVSSLMTCSPATTLSCGANGMRYCALNRITVLFDCRCVLFTQLLLWMDDERAHECIPIASMSGGGLI